MRTTVRIDDDLLRQLRDRAHRERTSISNLLNRFLRCGMEIARKRAAPVKYREKTFDMGIARVNLDKALALAAALEDEENIRKLALDK
jgi:hypothetical protein